MLINQREKTEGCGLQKAAHKGRMAEGEQAIGDPGRCGWEGSQETRATPGESTGTGQRRAAWRRARNRAQRSAREGKRARRSTLKACKRKEQEQSKTERNHVPKRHRLVFTDIQRRTLHAIFHENQRPSKELQVTIAQQLGLELSTVSNFFMNARRRSLDKWMDEGGGRPASSHTPNVASAITCTKA